MPATSMSMRQLLRWALLALGVLLLLALGVLVSQHLRAKSRLAALHAKAAAAGHHLKLSDFPDLTASATSAAAADELADLLRALLPGTTQRHNPMTLVAPGVARVAWTGTGVWQARMRTQTWASIELDLQSSSNITARIDKLVREAAPRAALMYELGDGILLKHLSELRTGGFGSALRAAVALRQNKPLDAIHAIETGFLIADVAARDRLLISALVVNAIHSLLFGACWELLQYPGLTESHLARLHELWTQRDPLIVLPSSLQVERAVMLPAFTSARAGTTTGRGLLQGVFGPANLPGAPETPDRLSQLPRFLTQLSQHLAIRLSLPVRERVWRWNWSYDDEAAYIQAIQGLIDCADAIAKGGTWDQNRHLLNLVRQLEDPQGSLGQRLPLSANALAGIESSMVRSVMSVALQRMMITGIAVHRHRLTHGHWPDSLDQLVPRFLGAVPQDPFAPGPIRYRRENDRWALYSVGPDARDDLGNPNPTNAIPQRSGNVVTQGRDLVWPRAATPEELEDWNRPSQPPPRPGVTTTLRPR